MSKVPKIAINGFGRIGRLTARALFELKKQGKNFELVAVNDLAKADILGHLFEYDSVHGRYDGKVEIDKDKNTITIDGNKVQVYSIRNPEELPWKDLGVDYVIESTGIFRDKVGASKHIKAGAKRVILSAPAKGDGFLTVVRGVNSDTYDPAKHTLVSNASCTTNCLAPVCKILHDAFEIEDAMMTTTHAVTLDQSIQDAQHSDPRRARAAFQSIIPTSTGAATAIGLVLPELNGKINGMALRVPVQNVSVVDLVAKVKNPPKSKDDLAKVFMEASEKPEWNGIFLAETKELVSIDFNHNSHSSIVDIPSLMVHDKLVKVLAFYDNEWGYSTRVAEVVHDIWAKEN